MKIKVRCDVPHVLAIPLGLPTSAYTRVLVRSLLTAMPQLILLEGRTEERRQVGRTSAGIGHGLHIDTIGKVGEHSVPSRLLNDRCKVVGSKPKDTKLWYHWAASRRGQ